MPPQKARKTGRRASKIRVNTNRVHEKPKSRGKSLLILECDADKLVAQSMSIADEIERVNQVIQPFASKVNIAKVKTSTEQNLKLHFAHLAGQNCRFGTIVVIGHSNASGLSLTSDRFVLWMDFPKWVELFEPKQMVLVACQSGQKPSACDLFAGIPTLKELYASPINTTKPQSEIIKVLVPYLLHTRSANSELIRLGQLINFWLTGGIIYRWLRKEFQLQKCSSRSEPTYLETDCHRPRSAPTESKR